MEMKTRTVEGEKNSAKENPFSTSISGKGQITSAALLL
jgi:hypothetical protein